MSSYQGAINGVVGTVEIFLEAMVRLQKVITHNPLFDSSWFFIKLTILSTISPATKIFRKLLARIAVPCTRTSVELPFKSHNS